MVKSKRIDDSEIKADFRLLVKSLNNTLRGLELANSDPGLCLAYQKLLSFLTNNDARLAEEIFGTREITKRQNSGTDNLFSYDDIAQLSIEDIEKILLNNDLPKTSLAQIAEIRFSVTKGTVSRSSREALCSKLRILIENEKTHQAIGRVARNSE